MNEYFQNIAVLSEHVWIPNSPKVAKKMLFMIMRTPESFFAFLDTKYTKIQIFAYI